MGATTAGYAMLTLVFEREGYKWVGTCEELGTSTYARTLKQCQRELDDLVTEHLNLLDCRHSHLVGRHSLAFALFTNDQASPVGR